MKKPHPLVSDAAQGRLPDWAVAGRERREHMRRVAGLLSEWADQLALDEVDRVRWRAAGHLHDALRDEDPDTLRPQVPERFRALPGKVLHGPAAAERIRGAGVSDDELVEAVAFHTIGGARLGKLGRALYAADFLEPGRTFLTDWRAALRARMPADLEAVLREIVRARVVSRLERAMPVLPETISFWNGLVSAKT